MLEGVIRDSIGKSDAKKLRRDGYLIANIYANGVANIHCAFKKNEFIRAVKSKDELIFPVKVGGQEHKVVVQEYQKAPITNELLHVDLKVALEDKESRYFVPVNLSGTPKGLKNKGVLVQPRKRIRVKCLAKDIPSSYDIDVSPLDVNDAFLVRDLPEHPGVKIYEKDTDAVAGVIKAK